MSLVAALLVAELSYRFYVLDFYAPELRAYNGVESADSLPTPADVLVMGDSYSAGQSSYVSMLRKIFPDCAIVNGAIPGSGLVEANVLAPSLFARVQPHLFVYQIYVGNDLINLRNPVNWSTISPVRNLYWLISDQLRVLGFANYRLGQIAAGSAEQRGAAAVDASPEPFSPSKYPSTTKNYLRADPRILEKQIDLEQDRAQDFQRFIRMLDDLLKNCKASDCQVYLLLIPNEVQVAAKYYHDMEQLGARFRASPAAMMATSYPFAARIQEIYGQRKRVHVVDVGGELRQAQANGVDTYLTNDPHLTPAGQQVVATRLAEELRPADLKCAAPKAGASAAR